MKKFLLLTVMLPLMATADVAIKCEQVKGKHFYNRNYANLTITTTEPVVLFIAQYREEDKVVSLDQNGVYTSQVISDFYTYGKYVTTVNGKLLVTQFKCFVE